MTAPLVPRCAWCDPQPLPADAQVTHTICPGCQAEIEADERAAEQTIEDRQREGLPGWGYRDQVE